MNNNNSNVWALTSSAVQRWHRYRLIVNRTRMASAVIGDEIFFEKTTQITWKNGEKSEIVWKIIHNFGQIVGTEQNFFDGSEKPFKSD